MATCSDSAIPAFSRRVTVLRFTVTHHRHEHLLLASFPSQSTQAGRDVLLVLCPTETQLRLSGQENVIDSKHCPHFILKFSVILQVPVSLFLLAQKNAIFVTKSFMKNKCYIYAF
jgi:hypothetical protein